MAGSSTEAREALRQRMREDGIELVLVQFVDIHGAAKVKMVPAAHLDDVIDEGAGFAGAALDGMGQGPHSHDMLARIDAGTYTPLPWSPGVARFASDLYVDGEPHPHCPRQNMRRVLGELREEGYVFNVGMEPEHFLVTRGEDGSIAVFDPDGVDTLTKPCYDFKGISNVFGYLSELMAAVNSLGWDAYQADHEDANGQYELNFGYDDALVTADRYTFFKMMTSRIARRHGAVATHMPKPFADRTGNGGHVHFHLARASDGTNVFEGDADGRGLGLSKTALHFVGGVLEHARALCAVTSPTVNCYKRLQTGRAVFGSRSGYTWTPVFITYGDNNRTQMIRTAGRGHLEDRTVSSACNPYLALAAYVAAGMDGVRRRLDPGEPNFDNMYELGPERIAERGIRTLPQSLPEALSELAADEVVRGALGPICDEFEAVKSAEWSEYHAQVSRWEIDRYLTMF